MNPYNGFTPEERRAAFEITKAAWRDGTATPPRECEVCGQTEGRIEAHDEDYTRPLDYYEVCYTCHMMIHCRYRDPFRWGQYLALVEAGATFRRARGWPDFRERYLEGELTAQVVGLGAPRKRSFAAHLPVVNTRSVPSDLPAPARFSA